MAPLAVLGAGAWGGALAIHYARQRPVRLWSWQVAEAADLQQQRVHAAALPGIDFPNALQVTANLAEACEAASAILVVTPVAGLRPTLTQLQALGELPPIVLCCKGFESGSGLLPSAVALEVLGQSATVAVLSGPSFAREVALGLPVAMTCASQHTDNAERLRELLHGVSARVYSSTDVVGVQVGGAVKNVLAIAAGIADGLDFGHNARAALITRGLAEISRLALALGGRAETLQGLSGLGDLVLTCTGDLSRNRRVGLLLAKGEPLATVLASLGHVAEGVPTTAEVARLAAGLGVDMPITQAVHAVLQGLVTPRAAVDALLARDPRPEQ
jgi:glycerol-3-phosphate dehydrogenase (NAD(P)+)